MVSFMEAHRTECRWQSKTLTAIITMIRKRKPGKGQTAKACVECSSTTKRPATKYSSLSAHPVTEDAEEKPLKEKTQVSESYAMPTGSNSTIARQMRLNAVLSSTGFI